MEQNMSKEERPQIKDLSRMTRKHRLRILKQIKLGQKSEKDYYSSADYR